MKMTYHLRHPWKNIYVQCATILVASVNVLVVSMGLFLSLLFVGIESPEEDPTFWNYLFVAVWVVGWIGVVANLYVARYILGALLLFLLGSILISNFPNIFSDTFASVMIIWLSLSFALVIAPWLAESAKDK